MESQLFDKLEAEIKHLALQENNLNVLVTYVAGESFDDEDRTMVHNKLMQITSTKKHLDEVLVKKKEIYHTQVKIMEERLTNRKMNLEDFSKKSNVFKDFPDVLDFFARKQSRLNESLASIKAKLVG
jgi:hypothetical protein